MQKFRTGLGSKVGRRFLAIFCLSSLLPLSAFAVVSFLEVNRQLATQNSERLHRTTKSLAHTLVDRLLLLKQELTYKAGEIYWPSGSEDNPTLPESSSRFLSLAVQRGSEILPLVGAAPEPVSLSEDCYPHLASGGALLFTSDTPRHPILLAVALDGSQPLRGILVGQPDPTFLFGTDYTNVDTPGTVVMVFDSDRRELFSSGSLSDGEIGELCQVFPELASTEFRWTWGDHEYVAYNWSIPLNFEFHTRQWHIVRSENQAWVFAPLQNFQRDFILLSLISLLIVAALSSMQIRRNLNPLAEFQQATRRIAHGDYRTAVEVFSGDEFEELARSFNLMSDEIRGLHVSTLTALARTVDTKSPWTAGHSERVAAMAVEIGSRLGLSESELATLQRGALLHDIGKIGVSSAILDKPDRLTHSEMSKIREHPVIGARILAPIKAFTEALPLIRGHHERIDGKGYPDGLKGDQIRFDVRILVVADAVDAMISDRPYRQGMSAANAARIIRQEIGRQFDARVSQVALELLGQSVDTDGIPIPVGRPDHPEPPRLQPPPQTRQHPSLEVL